VRLETNEPVCVTLTVLVTPVGKVVGETVEVYGAEPVDDTVDERVNRLVTVDDTDADCVLDAVFVPVIVFVFHIDRLFLGDVDTVDHDVGDLEASAERVPVPEIVLDFDEDELPVIVTVALEDFDG